MPYLYLYADDDHDDDQMNLELKVMVITVPDSCSKSELSELAQLTIRPCIYILYVYIFTYISLTIYHMYIFSW